MKKIVLGTILMLAGQISLAEDIVCSRVYQDESIAKFTLKDNTTSMINFAVDLFIDNKKIDTLVMLNQESSVIGRTGKYTFSNIKSNNSELLTLVLLSDGGDPGKLLDITANATLTQSIKSDYDKGIYTSVSYYNCKQ